MRKALVSFRFESNTESGEETRRTYVQFSGESTGWGMQIESIRTVLRQSSGKNTLGQGRVLSRAAN